MIKNRVLQTHVHVTSNQLRSRHENISLKREEMGAESANDDEDYSCCCCSCLSISKTAATFLKYVFILFITWVISLLLLMPDLREKAVGNNTLCVSYLSKETCSNFFGYNAVYRVYFAIGFVHFVMSLCLIGATSSESGLRTRIHHGLWSVKCLVLIGKFIHV